MKETMDPTPVKPSEGPDNFANRKLIRPALPRVDHNHGNHNSNQNSAHLQLTERRERHERPERGMERGGERSYDRGERSMGGGGGGGRKSAPPEQTNAEN